MGKSLKPQAALDLVRAHDALSSAFCVLEGQWPDWQRQRVNDMLDELATLRNDAQIDALRAVA